MDRWVGLSIELRCSALVAVLLVVMAAMPGCGRRFYRNRADVDSYTLIGEKSGGTPWQVPYDYSIEVDPRSRLFDPTNPVRPFLPPAGPQLYQYQLPQLASNGTRPVEAIPIPPMPAAPNGADPGLGGPELPMGRRPIMPSRISRLPPTAAASIQLMSHHEPLPDPAWQPGGQPQVSGLDALAIQKIKNEYWDRIPRSCLARMLEFRTVRDEYVLNYGSEPPTELLDAAQRLSLEAIIEIGKMNSREYQTQKETLYRSALALSLERFDYASKFSVSGNGVDANYTHNRSAGITVNSLSVPSSARADKMLATGGTLLATFANDVLLTFNGPTGFAADVSSDLVFNITQSVFQRDILLNPLIQSERNLVYSSRTFARFRKSFFFDLASTYYQLLRTYRQIEIDSQNYFSVVRNFEQAQEEVRSQLSQAPNQVAVNQFEQQVLSGLSSLISTCNSLEQSLDSLKIDLGIPTETPINLDLFELEQLTLRDEIEVAGERVRRWDARLRALQQLPEVAHGEVLNAGTFLVERLLQWLSLRAQLGEDVPDPRPLAVLQSRFATDSKRLDVVDARRELGETLSAMPPAPRILVFQRRVTLILAAIELCDKQIEMAVLLRRSPSEIAEAQQRRERLATTYQVIQDRLEEVLEAGDVDRLAQLLIDATGLTTELEQLIADLDRTISEPDQIRLDKNRSMMQADQALAITQQLFARGSGLPAVHISVDDAMLTALTQRLDLMNERGFLADDWRAIKLAADDLKSVLNLNATQSFFTPNNLNRPFSFSMDDSSTALRLSFDLPLNRRAQRNSFRRSLIDYQAGRRSLMAAEDNIKLAIRNEMRNLELARVQYPIAVASAALSAEQVISTQLQLQLGVPAVRATDLVDALADSQQALSAVANSRIGFVIERARFALDLELMMLDDEGLWPDIKSVEYDPRPDYLYPPNAGPMYGEIPRFLKVSHELKQMQFYPRPHGPPGPPPEILYENP